METTFEQAYRTMQVIEEMLDDRKGLSVREMMFADRLAIIAKRVAQRIEQDILKLEGE